MIGLVSLDKQKPTPPQKPEDNSHRIGRFLLWWWRFKARGFRPKWWRK